MITTEERLLKIEHDAWLANYEANRTKAMTEYIAIMDYPEVLEESEVEINE